MSKKSMLEFQRKLSDIEAAKRTRKENNEVFKTFMMLSMYILHKEQGFGPKRMDDYIDSMSKLIADVNRNEPSVEEIKETLRTKCKIEIEELL